MNGQQPAVSGWSGMGQPQSAQTGGFNPNNAIDQSILGGGANGQYAVDQSPTISQIQPGGSPSLGTMASLGMLAMML